MTDMKLTVVCDLNSMELFPQLSDAGFPAGIAGSIAGYDGGPLAPEEGAGLLFLTDDLAHLRAALDDASGRLYAVYIGSAVYGFFHWKRHGKYVTSQV